MSAPRFYAGIDGGATKTVAVVVDDNDQERGRGAASGSNQAVVGLETAVAQIQTALLEALEKAGAIVPVEAAWIGLAGVDRPADREAFLPQLEPLAGRLTVTNDAELALTALPGAVGVAVIAGTGSIMLGRDARGQTARAGGWGHLMGDEGSGYALGRLALLAAARAHDRRGPATALLADLLSFWRLSEPEGLIDKVYQGGGGDKDALARLAPLVVAAARDGDAVARRIVADAAAELALGARVVADQLDFADGAVPLSLAGGLLVNEPAFRTSVVRRLRRRRQFGPVAVVGDPALSAAKAARAQFAREQLPREVGR